jgi:hypothetical protein
MSCQIIVYILSMVLTFTGRLEILGECIPFILALISLGICLIHNRFIPFQLPQRCAVLSFVHQSHCYAAQNDLTPKINANFDRLTDWIWAGWAGIEPDAYSSA